MAEPERTRCWWCGDDELYQDYHDFEWGVPVHDERLLFEFLCLEGAQAGLSWITILRKRENYRRAFDNFDAGKIVRYKDKKIAALLQDPGIVRNRLKVNGFVKNARALLELQEQGMTLDEYLWDFVDGEPLQTSRKTIKQVPSNTAISDAMSKDLKKRGFTFVGSTICYAFMQAAGLVNDHTVDCFRHPQLK
ncbi:MAG: DNA-3-methyladenine glycosylase I, partial [Gammaproteobacteria bacterium]